MKIMYKLILFGVYSDSIIAVSKKYYSSYQEAQKAAERRYKMTGLVWTIKPVKLG